MYSLILIYHLWSLELETKISQSIWFYSTTTLLCVVFSCLRAFGRICICAVPSAVSVDWQPPWPAPCHQQEVCLKPSASDRALSAKWILTVLTSLPNDWGFDREGSEGAMWLADGQSVRNIWQAAQKLPVFEFWGISKAWTTEANC